MPKDLWKRATDRDRGNLEIRQRATEQSNCRVTPSILVPKGTEVLVVFGKFRIPMRTPELYEFSSTTAPDKDGFFYLRTEKFGILGIHCKEVLIGPPFRIRPGTSIKIVSKQGKLRREKTKTSQSFDSINQIDEQGMCWFIRSDGRRIGVNRYNLG